MIVKILDKTIRKGTAQDRGYLLQLRNHPEMGSNSKLVYIYRLYDDKFNYPKKMEVGFM
jgi:hypothetical protein